MFADYVKMGAKAVALGLAVAVIIGFLAGFQLPSVNLSFVGDYMNKVYTIGTHYIPYFQVMWGLGVTLLTLNITLYGIKLALIAYKWVLKVNE